MGAGTTMSGLPGIAVMEPGGYEISTPPGFAASTKGADIIVLVMVVPGLPLVVIVDPVLADVAASDIELLVKFCEAKSVDNNGKKVPSRLDPPV